MSYANVVHGDVAIAITGFLVAKDVCSMFSINRETRDSIDSLQARNAIWQGLYRRDFPSWTLGPDSKHRLGLACMSQSTCKRVRHHTQLLPQTAGFLRFRNFFHQYVSRTLTRIRKIQRAAEESALCMARRALRDTSTALLQRRQLIREMRAELTAHERSVESLERQEIKRKYELDNVHRSNVDAMFTVAMDWEGRESAALARPSGFGPARKKQKS